MGYNIIVEEPDVPYLIGGTPAEDWYKGIDKWRTGPYFFSHITELIRLATLWKYGGVYLDTDVIVMKCARHAAARCSFIPLSPARHARPGTAQC